jgi:hypothetical protein
VELLAVVLSLLLTLATVLVGMAKVQHLPASLQVRDAAAVPSRVWLVSGWVELVAAAFVVVGVFAVHALAVAAAALLALDFAALALRQLTWQGPGASAVPALVLSVLALGTIVSIIAAGL